MSITNQVHIKSSVTESAQISDGFKDTIRGIEKSLSDLTVQVGKCIEDLDLKIKNLLSQTGLQMEVDSIQSQPTSAGVTMRPSSTSASAAYSAAHSIIDELTDRDRRKKNIIIYNLPEATDHAAVKVSFLALCKTVFNLDVLVTRVSYTFRKKTGKQAQTLTCVFCTCRKMTKRLLIISHSNLLRRHDQFERVFIAPD